MARILLPSWYASQVRHSIARCYVLVNRWTEANNSERPAASGLTGSVFTFAFALGLRLDGGAHFPRVLGLCKQNQLLAVKYGIHRSLAFGFGARRL
jgi:hypothetical protein